VATQKMKSIAKAAAQLRSDFKGTRTESAHSN
jgi:hypothetical protein